MHYSAQRWSNVGLLRSCRTVRMSLMSSAWVDHHRALEAGELCQHLWIKGRLSSGQLGDKSCGVRSGNIRILKKLRILETVTTAETNLPLAIHAPETSTSAFIALRRWSASFSPRLGHPTIATS